MTSGLVAAVVAALSRHPRDAEIQRDGALALGAWALASLSAGPPGFNAYAVPGADALNLFASAALSKLGPHSAGHPDAVAPTYHPPSRGAHRLGGGDVPAGRTALLPGVNAGHQGLTDVRAAMAARKRIAQQLMGASNGVSGGESSPVLALPQAGGHAVSQSLGAHVKHLGPKPASLSRGSTPRGSATSTYAAPT